MTLSRNLFVSRYGTFQRLMETRNIHGGYGDVTWNVGPHAGHEPYGPNHKVVFVDRGNMTRDVRVDSIADVQRHAHEIGQQMDRGDVINVPHVRFEDGKPVFDAAHHGAIMAAAQRGADKIPVVFNKAREDEMWDHVGSIQTPGARKPGQDKNYKWRWNGKGWYTKPSFNQGRCPTGSNPDASADRCVGGGPAPGSAVSPEASPAHHRGVRNHPPELGSASRRIRPRGPIGRTPEELPTSLHQYLDRSEIPGAPVKLPPGYGLAHDTTKYRMDTALGASDIEGNERPITLDHAEGDTEENRRAKDAIKAAHAEMLSAHPDKFQPGEFLGAGAAGAVFRGPKEPDGTDTVYKFDAGPYEARIADATMRAGLVGSNGLAILPRYISTTETSIKHSRAGLPIHVIHREDLNSVNTVLSAEERHILGGKDQHRMRLGRLPSTVSGLMQLLQHASNPVEPPHGVDPNDIGAENTRFQRTWGGGIVAMPKRLGGRPIPWSEKRGRGLTRKSLLHAFDSGITTIRARAMMGRGVLARQWPRIESELRELLMHGIALCDLHEDNWGIRKNTGEITIRDAGCASVIEH